MKKISTNDAIAALMSGVAGAPKFVVEIAAPATKAELAKRLKIYDSSGARITPAPFPIVWADVVAKHTEEADVTFPSLLDPGGAYFAAVATERLPRIYLLDADGKILWFDMEYTETTRGALKQAIHASK